MISGGRFTRLVIIFVAVIGLIGLLYPPQANAESLSQLLQRQADLRRQADESKKKLEKTKGVVNDLTGIVGGLDEDITETQTNITNTEAQIAVTEEVISELAVDIDQTQTELDALQLKLRNAYISLYELSQASPLDTILASSSLNEMVSQTQYIQSLQTELQGNIDKTNVAKSELESKQNESVAQKTGLVSLKQDLTKSKNALNSRRSQKTYLLTQTQGQQAQYEALLKQISQEATQIADEIYRKRQELGGNGSGTGGYAYANSTPDTPDRWSFLTRECTSYAAWKWNSVYGVPWYRNPLPEGISNGHAKYWPAMARDRGIPTGSTPSVGAFVVWGAGSYNSTYIDGRYGHVAIVEQVYSPTDIEISEYNWFRFAYSYRRINPNTFGTPIYISFP